MQYHILKYVHMYLLQDSKYNQTRGRQGQAQEFVIWTLLWFMILGPLLLTIPHVLPFPVHLDLYFLH